MATKLIEGWHVYAGDEREALMQETTGENDYPLVLDAGFGKPLLVIDRRGPHKWAAWWLPEEDLGTIATWRAKDGAAPTYIPAYKPTKFFRSPLAAAINAERNGVENTPNPLSHFNLPDEDEI